MRESWLNLGYEVVQVKWKLKFGDVKMHCMMFEAKKNVSGLRINLDNLHQY